MTTDEVVSTQDATAAEGPGRIVGDRYLLDHVVGRGGMAEVWQARDVLLRRNVAVKIFRGEVASPAEEHRRHSEIRVVAGLSHPNLVTVFDAGTDSSSPGAPCTYLVMELVEGPTFARLLGNGPLPPVDVADVGAQLAGALAYVHARGIVHRDLKPANVLLTAAGGAHRGVTAKLTDFGVARVLDGTRLTLSGTTVGTANYLSPEQASGKDVTRASDIYSLGLLLLECLTGSTAFPGHGVEAALARLHRDPTIPQYLDPSWQGLLAAMTARDPAIRPAAATVANRLRTLAGQQADEAPYGQLSGLVQRATTQALALRPGAAAGMSGSVHPSLPGGVDWRRHGHRSRAVWVAAAIMLLVAAAGAVLVLLVRGGATSGSGSSTPTRPYPTVSGRLGTDLRRLQDAVS